MFGDTPPPVMGALLDLISADFKILPGRPLPLGASATRGGLNFALFSRHATAVNLVLFASGYHEPLLELPLDTVFHRTGDVWHLEIVGIAAAVRYGWRLDRQPVPQDGFHRFDATKVLIDPYATALTGAWKWGVREYRAGEPRRDPTPVRADSATAGEAAGTSADGESIRRRSLFVPQDFDWEMVRPPRVPFPDKIIYELHVRGFTQHPSAAAADPGTYRGLIEKIPYIKDLGVTTVELLPVYEFDEYDNPRTNPLTGERLKNYWGYSPLCFFAPKAAYARSGRDGGQVAEFKTLVREFHRAGIEVILDVVFNHTAEGTDPEQTSSFRGIDNLVYYILDPVTGEYRDYSGCGNTLNCNHPVVRDTILDALRYWVSEFHVDGFRFDLASVLGRGPQGEVLARPPLLERIGADPVLADALLIAEAWDAAGLYQVGMFPSWGRWAEWNGIFRDDVRQFVRGAPGFAARLATRLAGSSDLYHAAGRGPSPSINFVTCHDGFTAADLVAYNDKHNEANGEENRDGMDDNESWNCGVEGPTDDARVLQLRRRQTRNLLTLLLLSQGTPMLVAGDEFGRTQGGNNNAYCQDNEISWIDWGLLERNRDLHRFVKLLIAFRGAHPALRRTTFLSGHGTAGHPQPDVTWHGARLHQPDWGPTSRGLAMHLAGVHAPAPDCDIFFAANSAPDDVTFELPEPPARRRWLRVVDTARPAPDDIAEPGREVAIDAPQVTVAAYACVVLRSG
jgi:isoamylase